VLLTNKLVYLLTANKPRWSILWDTA